MKIKTLRRKFADIRKRLTAFKDHLSQPYEDRIRVLYYAMKEVYNPTFQYFKTPFTVYYYSHGISLNLVNKELRELVIGQIGIHR